MKKIGLALSGGGARGLCFVDFLKVLDELDIKPSIISGSSIGAIFGAFYASGVSGQEIEELLGDINILELYKFIDFSLFAKSALMKGRAIEKFFHEHIPCKKFEELQIPLKVVATDFWKREQVIFQHGELIPAIRASMSLPAIFEPVVLHNHVFVDGGASNPLPHDIIRNECDYLIAIDVSGDLEQPKTTKIPSIFDCLMSTLQTMQNSIIKHKMSISYIDLFIRPQIKNIGILEFFKEKEIRAAANQEVERFRKILEIEKQYILS